MSNKGTMTIKRKVTRVLSVILIGLSILLSSCGTSNQPQPDNTLPVNTQPSASPLPTITQSSGNILPADLLFTERGWEARNTYTLMRIDAQTLEESPLYVAEDAYIRALSWSPAGDLLAVLRWPSMGDYLEICLLTREGVLQTCFEDRITSYLFRERGENYLVTWSGDGRYVYFVTDYGQFERYLDDIISWEEYLVKADVETGQTQQTLYQPPLPKYFPPPDLFWTNDLHYVQARQWDFTIMQMVSTVTDLSQNVEIPLPQEIPDMGQLEFCAGFSPQEQYLTARTSLDSTLTGWVLTTPEGYIVQTVPRDKLELAGIEWMECPVWQSDGTAFHFIGGPEDEARLFKYVLGDETITNVKQLYPPDAQDTVLDGHFPAMPMTMAPDNATLIVPFLIGPSSTEFHLLTPEIEWETARDGQALIPYGEYPIWFPNTESN